MKKIVLAIHGGDTFPSFEKYIDSLEGKEVYLDRMKPRDDWKKNLEVDLGNSLEVFLPSMPLSDNADYELWKFWFEKVLAKLDELPILVGHSLGAMFLAKYCSEEKKDKKFPGVFLVAPEFLDWKIQEEEKTNFVLSEKIANLTKNSTKVVFYYSEDDMVVPFDNQARFKKVVPDAEYCTFSDRGHFLDAHFPELVKAVQNLS